MDLESESAPLKPCRNSEQSDHSQLPFNENIVGGDSVGKARGRPAAGTLVVCPTSVMRQWADELHKKVTSEANLSVLVYHGSSRTKDPHELAKYDVVVTTYSIVVWKCRRSLLLMTRMKRRMVYMIKEILRRGTQRRRNMLSFCLALLGKFHGF